MTQIYVEHEGSTYSTQVEDIANAERMVLAERCPDSLTDVSSADEFELNTETAEFFDYVVESYTALGHSEIQSLPVAVVGEMAARTLAVLFEAGDTYSMYTGQSVRKVVLSEEFIEGLFSRDISVVGGMPDDVTLEDYALIPHSNSIEYIFSSEEWDKLSPDESVPVHETFVVSRDSSTEEI
jgi:hypothetical protein